MRKNFPKPAVLHFWTKVILLLNPFNTEIL